SLVTGGVLYWTTSEITSSESSGDAVTTILVQLQLYWASIFVGFLIEAYPRGNTRVQRLAREKEHQTIYDQANFGSRYLYCYVNGLLSLGASRPLRVEDVPDLAEQESLADYSYNELNRVWTKAKAKCRQHTVKDGQSRQPSLLKAIAIAQRGMIIPFLITRIIAVMLGYALPECLKYFILFIEDYSEAKKFPERYPDGGPSKRIGFQLAVLMFIIMATSTVISAESIQISYSLASSIRASLIQIVYRKSLLLSPEARQENSIGAIVNHMSVDAEMWIAALHFLPFLVTTPIELVLASFMLYRQIGWSVIGGLAVVLLMNPLQSLLSRLKVKAEAGKLKKMDMRVRSMNEILAGIKIIKLYGWEDSFRNRIEEIRRQEIQQLKRTTVVDAYMKILYSSATLPMALATFALYSTIGGPGWTPGKMTADIIVVSVALFGMLNRPIGLFGNAIGQLIITQVSTGRVQKFLLADEIDTN
ncbi:Canalicular multispecific organic anion transporter 2, partial [Actinomortierella wolfii]